MAEYHRVIGIDLGTTFSVVAAYSYDKKDVKVIPNRQNEPTTPSVVYVAPDGRVSVGKAAQEKLAQDPNRVILEVKRLMGEQEDGHKAMAHGAGVELDPEVVSAHILKELKACAEKVIGEPIHDAVITVPARFKETAEERHARGGQDRQAQPPPDHQRADGRGRRLRPEQRRAADVRRLRLRRRHVRRLGRPDHGRPDRRDPRHRRRSSPGRRRHRPEDRRLGARRR